MTPPEVRVIGIEGIPMIQAGDDLAGLIFGAAVAQGTPIEDGDVIVVTQRVVSKAEGRVVPLDSFEPQPVRARLGDAVREGPTPDRGRPARVDPHRAASPRRAHHGDAPRLHLRQRRRRRLERRRRRCHLAAARGPGRLVPRAARRRSRAAGRRGGRDHRRTPSAARGARARRTSPSASLACSRCTCTTASVTSTAASCA